MMSSGWHNGAVSGFLLKQSVLSILLSVIFLVLAPLRIWSLRTRPRMIVERGFQIMKLVGELPIQQHPSSDERFDRLLLCSTAAYSL